VHKRFVNDKIVAGPSRSNYLRGVHASLSLINIPTRNHFLEESVGMGPLLSPITEFLLYKSEVEKNH
jgi:hypothetical protein